MINLFTKRMLNEQQVTNNIVDMTSTILMLYKFNFKFELK